jgi:hypothetical protein
VVQGCKHASHNLELLLVVHVTNATYDAPWGDSLHMMLKGQEQAQFKEHSAQQGCWKPHWRTHCDHASQEQEKVPLSLLLLSPIIIAETITYALC